MAEKTFRSMAEFRAHYFPNMVEKPEEPKEQIIFIIPRPSVR
jgi:hypothetical protein